MSVDGPQKRIEKIIHSTLCFLLCNTEDILKNVGGTVRVLNRTVHGANSKLKGSSLSPWSGDFGVNKMATCVPLFSRLECTW